MLSLQQDNGEIWSALGSSRQHVHVAPSSRTSRTLLSHAGRSAKGLFCLPTRIILPPEPQGIYLLTMPLSTSVFLTLKQENPKLWYGIGILYDRYGSLDNAEEAFSSVLRMDKGTLVHPRPQFYISFE